MQNFYKLDNQKQVILKHYTKVSFQILQTMQQTILFLINRIYGEQITLLQRRLDHLHLTAIMHHMMLQFKFMLTEYIQKQYMQSEDVTVLTEQQIIY